MVDLSSSKSEGTTMAEDKGLYRKKDEQFSYNPKGKNYLFVVGINDYLHFTKLSNAVKDAKDLVEILTTYYHFEKENIIELFDKEATRGNIVDKFEYLVGRLEKDDNLLIYFSGHGHLNERTNIGYWIPVEANRVADYVPNSSVRDYLQVIKSHHTFVIADACFSGSLFSGTSKRLETERYITEVDKHRSRWALTSGRLEVVSDGQRGLNSPFASYLLKYLREEGKPPFAVYDLVQYVKKATANNAEQTPIGGSLQGVGDEGGEFVFYPRENEEIAWQNARYQNTIQGYQAFLDKYPQSNYAFQAENAIIQLNEELDAEAYQKACKLNTSIGYYDYIDSYPNGKYAAEARTKMREREQVEKEKEAKDALESAKRSRSLSELMDFKDRYQNFPALIAEANTLIEDIKNQKTPDFQTFEKFDAPKTPDNKIAREDTDNGKNVVSANGFETRNTNTQTQPTIFEKNKKIIFSALAIVLLLVVFFVFKDKIGGVPLPSGEAIVADTTKSVSDKAETTVSSPSGENTTADTTKSVSAEAKTTVPLASAEEIAKQEEETAYKALKNTEASYTAFLQKYPNSTYKEDVQKRLDLLNKPADLPFQEPEMVYVEGNTFDMGCTSEQQDCGSDEKPLHSVKVSSFYMGKYEVTIREYMIFVNETQSNYPEWQEKGNTYNLKTGKEKKYYVPFVVNDKQPIVGVSWNNVVAYCKWLTKKTGKNYRLPTEAEWEYAARGGNKSNGYQYAGSNTLSSVAWNTDNSGNKTHPVGQKSPNELGIYDMSGNVWEWCSDWYGDYSASSQTNPKGANSGSYRVDRGGGWISGAVDLRVAIRNYYAPAYRGINLGFRLVCL